MSEGKEKPSLIAGVGGYATTAGTQKTQMEMDTKRRTDIMKKIETGCQDKLDWFDGKHINEILFCQEFLKTHPMRCIGGTLFTVDGPVESEELVKRQIIDMIQSCITTNLSKRASSLLESLKIQAYSEPLPVELDRIHCANGIYFLDGHFEPKRFSVTIGCRLATIQQLQNLCVGCNLFQNC